MLCQHLCFGYLDVFDVVKLTSMKFNLVVMWNCTTLTATITVCSCREVCVLFLAISLTDYLMFRVIHVVFD